MSTELRRAQWAAMQEIDRVAGEARSTYLGRTLAQEEVYREKYAEAVAHQAAPAAPAGPFLAAEAQRCQLSVPVLAAAIVAQHQHYRSASPAIEAERRGGKHDVRAATSPERIEAALTASVAALRALAA
jgi:hypothetical protein